MTRVAMALLLTWRVAPAAAQVWEVDDLALAAGEEDELSRYGATVAVGDFNADGIDDLAIASPDADGAASGVGKVQIRFGGATRTLEISLESSFGTSTNDARLGASLVAGNFDDSPQDELAIGAPGDSDGTVASGRVCIVEFAPTVTHSCFSQLQIPSPAGGVADAGDKFGAALAVGNFDGDAFQDLAIGAPWKDRAAPLATNAGRVFVLFGSASGLRLDSSARGFHTADAAEFANYGRALAAGNFDADAFDDLAIGEPGRTLSGQSSAGRIEVVFGSATGPDLARHQLLSNVSFGITHEADDEFGSVLVSGDFDRGDLLDCLADGCPDDLAVGSPLEDVGSAANAGIVLVTYGTAGDGLSTTFFQILDQSDLGYTVEAGDLFGWSLAAGQVDGLYANDLLRRGDDLAIGCPGEQPPGGLAGQGTAYLLFAYGTEGLDAQANQALEVRAGLASAPAQAGDAFGLALAIGDFDGDGPGDLAVGIPNRNGALWLDSGIVQVMYGGLFADGFERGTAAGWSPTAP